jgi:D-alanine-D-alanine ligase
MALLPLKIGLLHYQPEGEPMDPVVENIEAALAELGHESVGIAVHDRVGEIVRAIEEPQYDLVFNLCETFAGDYRLEVNVAALMEMSRVPYTGAGVAGLLLAQDKMLTKQLLGYHDIRTPNYASFDGEAFEAHGMLSFPLIVKPARTDASMGIGRNSVVSSWDDLTRRVRDIRRELNDESLAEEFIEGREVYVGVLGGPARPEILPIVELDWGNWDPSKPRVSDREVKFGPETEGSPRLVVATDIPEDVRFRIERSALLAFRVLKLRDYARVDFRISEKTGEAYVLEANPNPYLEKNSEIALGAADRGLNYTQLIGRIVESAAARYKIPRKAPPTEPRPEEPEASSGELPDRPLATRPRNGEGTGGRSALAPVSTVAGTRVRQT